MFYLAVLKKKYLHKNLEGQVQIYNSLLSVIPHQNLVVLGELALLLAFDPQPVSTHGVMDGMTSSWP